MKTERKTNLMHKLFLVYFINLYVFRAYLGPSSSNTTLSVQQSGLIISSDDCLLSQLDWNTRVKKKKSLMHNALLVYLINPYMFRAYLGPSSGGKNLMYTTVGTYCSEKRLIQNHLSVYKKLKLNSVSLVRTRTMSVYTYHKICEI